MEGKAYVGRRPATKMRASTAVPMPAKTFRPLRGATAPRKRIFDLFRRMRAGEFRRAKKTLRAKIDLASPQHEHA